MVTIATQVIRYGSLILDSRHVAFSSEAYLPSDPTHTLLTTTVTFSLLMMGPETRSCLVLLCSY